MGIAALARGRAPKRGWRTVAAASLAFIIAYALKERLKYVMGRTWPETWVNHNPSWIANGAFGFHPFNGGEGWASFPSGHMTMISSVCAVLWARVRRLRWLWALLPALVAIGLFGSDYHWVSDMVAGTFLGVATAAGVLAYLPEAPERRADPPPPS